MMRAFGPDRRVSKKRKKDPGLIKAFIDIQNLRDDYEVWAPYFYHGVMGFSDLVVETRSSISLFKFRRDAENLEESVKGLKLENKFLPKSRNAGSKRIQSYLVFADKEENRKSILSQFRLLENQPFEILLLDRQRNRVESLFELKDFLPRLFQTRDMRLEEGALDDLVKKPNCAEISRAILNLGDSPATVSSRLIERVDGYMKRNEEPPEGLEAIKESQEEKETKPYVRNRARKKMGNNGNGSRMSFG